VFFSGGFRGWFFALKRALGFQAVSTSFRLTQCITTLFSNHHRKHLFFVFKQLFDFTFICRVSFRFLRADFLQFDLLTKRHGNHSADNPKTDRTRQATRKNQLFSYRP